MPRIGLSREKVIEQAAALANEKGLEYVTITTLAGRHLPRNYDIWLEKRS